MSDNAPAGTPSRPIPTPAPSGALPDPERMRALASRLGEAAVALVGDLAADRYIVGETRRVSREAPVPVIVQTEEFLVPGQAGNVAANISAHGAEARLVAYLGEDAASGELRASLRERNIDTDRLVSSRELRAQTKTRLLAGARHTRRQQVARFDVEDFSVPPEECRKLLRQRAREAVAGAGACVVSDYGYQVVDGELWAALRAACAEAGVPLLLDSRQRLGAFPGADVATPNEEEALSLAGWSGGPAPSPSDLARDALAASGANSMLLTRGSEGMVVHARPGARLPFPLGLGEGGTAAFGVNGSDKPVDVSGAGDTVVATVAMALAIGATLLEAAHLANVAAGISVAKVGAASVSPEELLAAMEAWPGELRPARTGGDS